VGVTAVEALRAAGVDEPEREARLLQKYFPHAAEFEAALERRCAREPLSHILGVREFWSLDFMVTRACLDPRPDSETLVEAVLAALPDRAHPWRILDLGTGSGCLLLALLSELPRATGLGVDSSPAALGVALANAQRLGLAPRARFAERDWAHGIEGSFDVIVANPPYIPSGEIDALAPEVARYEPRAALDGGPDGLAAYRTIVPALPRHLAEGGIAALEVGDGQAAAVGELSRAAGLNVTICRDLAGRERCLILRKSKKNIGKSAIRD
jgi:release factor glutamine methyltransferase